MPAFATETISSEFIVKYAGFYIEKTRQKYISLALKDFSPSMLEIVHRNNPMAAYPSDFDVLVCLSIVAVSRFKVVLHCGIASHSSLDKVF